MRLPSNQILLSTVLLLTLMVACKTSQKIPYDPDQSKVSRDSILSVLFTESTGEWFSAKAKISIQDNDGSRKATGYIRMKNDSLIWMAFKKLSLEAARTLIREDSIFILYRMEKKYEAHALDSLSHVFGLVPDLGFISALIDGRIPAVDSSHVWKEKTEKNLHKIRCMSQDILLDLEFDRNTGLLKSGKFYDRFLKNGNWTYSDYRMVGKRWVPFQRNFRINFDDENFMHLEIEFSEIEIGTPVEIRFQIPDHYEQI